MAICKEKSYTILRHLIKFLFVILYSHNKLNMKTDINNFEEGDNHIMKITSNEGAASGSLSHYDLEEELTEFLATLGDGDVDGGGVHLDTKQWDLFIYDITKQDTVKQLISFMKEKEIASDIKEVAIRRDGDDYEYSDNLWNS